MRHAAAFRSFHFRQVFQFHAEHRALECLPFDNYLSDFIVEIPRFEPCSRKERAAPCQSGVVGHKRAALAARAEVFAR